MSYPDSSEKTPAWAQKILDLGDSIVDKIEHINGCIDRIGHSIDRMEDLCAVSARSVNETETALRKTWREFADSDEFAHREMQRALLSRPTAFVPRGNFRFVDDTDGYGSPFSPFRQ